MKCGNCKETLQEGLVNHVMTVKEKTILIKDVPAMICSQCGEYYFKTKVMLTLEKLINEFNGISEIGILNYRDIA